MKMSKPMALAAVAAVLALASDGDAPKPEPRYDPTKPPGHVPWPEGWKRYDGTVSDEMKAAAKQALSQKLGTLVPGGVIAETGKSWGILLEWHFHPPGQGFSAEGWHKGATLIVQS